MTYGGHVVPPEHVQSLVRALLDCCPKCGGSGFVTRHPKGTAVDPSEMIGHIARALSSGAGEVAENDWRRGKHLLSHTKNWLRTKGKHVA